MEFNDDDHDEEKREANADEDAGHHTNFPVQPHHGGGRKGSAANPTFMTRYRECLKNHAVSSGGHAVDGCGEFMPAGEAGTLEALTCAACSCHRNFHRKETDTSSFAGGTMYPQLPAPPYYRTPPPPPPGFFYPGHHLQFRQRPVHRSSTEEMEALSNPSSSGGGEGKKRFRTKFTPEQKEKMVAFAEKLGWRIQKHDEAALQQFCEEVQVNRQVLKVWMHNNKHRNPNLSR